MLRITVQEEANNWRLKVEGKLAGPWVNEVETIFRAAPKGKTLVIDLRSVTSTDSAGKQLLCAMHRAGATLETGDVNLNCLADDIRKGLLMAVLAVVMLVMPLQAQDAPAPLSLTLRDAVEIALNQNPRVAIANLNLAQASEGGNQARSALLPQANFVATDAVRRGNIQALVGRQIPGLPQHNGPFWTIQAGPGVSVPLFDLTLWHRWQAAKRTTDASSADRTTVREINAQMVVSQYLGALRAQADVEAAKSRMDLAKALLDLAMDMQDSGVGTGIDTLRANVQYQNETQRHTEAATQLEVSLYGLNQLLNLNPEQEIVLADSSKFFETPEFTANQSLTQAFDARPEVRTIVAQIQASEQKMKAAKAQRLPRLSVGGNWTLQGLTPTSMIPVYQFGATLEVPIFTGGRIEAETAQAEIEIRKLEQAQMDLRNQIALEVKTAVAQLESARTQVETANLGVTLSRETVAQAQDRFRAGVANNIEVITAQDDLARANDNQIKALYRYNQSRADLARATGQMEAIYSK